MLDAHYRCRTVPLSPAVTTPSSSAPGASPRSAGRLRGFPRGGSSGGATRSARGPRADRSPRPGPLSARPWAAGVRPCPPAGAAPRSPVGSLGFEPCGWGSRPWPKSRSPAPRRAAEPPSPQTACRRGMRQRSCTARMSKWTWAARGAAKISVISLSQSDAATIAASSRSPPDLLEPLIQRPLFLAAIGRGTLRARSRDLRPPSFAFLRL